MKNHYKYFTILLLITSFAKAQSYHCQEKLLNCKEIVINGFKYNDINFTNKLSDELVKMQLCDPTLGKQFTNWYESFSVNYKTQMDSELQNLQNEKNQIEQHTQAVRTNTNNAIMNQNQKYIEQSKATNSNKGSKGMSKEEYDALHPFGAGSIR